MHQHDAVLDAVFAAANLAIAAGYGAIPFLVLPFIRLTRTALVFGAGFFLTCGWTHVGMAFGSGHITATWWWTVEHVAQAICTWGFIITFHTLLRRAHALRARMQAGDPP